MKIVGRAVVEGSGEDRSGRGDEPLVVQERSAERCVEEVIQDHGSRRAGGGEVAVDGELPRVVVALSEADRIASVREAIHPAAGDLILLLVEPMNEVFGLLIERNVVVDREGLVAEMAAESAG